MIAIDIREHDFNIGDEYAELCSQAPRAGAVVFFVGLVRDLYVDESDDRVDHIELSHYAGMTETLCESICQQANERFPYDAARVVHRVGKLAAGAQIVFVAVASRHRENAFQAAQYIMDYLKTNATLWKKEVGSRGENWVGMKENDQQATLRWEQS